MIAHMHDNLPLTTSEDSLYYWQSQIAINLYSIGKTWQDLDTTNTDSLTRVVQYNKAAGYMAGGASTLLGTGIVTWPVPILDSTATAAMSDTTQTSQRGISANGSTTATEQGLLFTIAPNPTCGQLQINSSIGGIFSLQSIDGRKIATIDLILGANKFQFPSSLSEGIYIGIFKPSDNSDQHVTKLIYRP